MNEVSTVSAVAQEALVRFVQFLQDDSLKTPDSPPSSGGMVETPRLEDEVKRPHVHRHYDMPKRARDLIRDDVIDEIVLALFRMQERPAAFASLFKDQSSHSREITSPGEVSVGPICSSRDCDLPMLAGSVFQVFALLR